MSSSMSQVGASGFCGSWNARRRAYFWMCKSCGERASCWGSRSWSRNPFWERVWMHYDDRYC